MAPPLNGATSEDRATAERYAPNPHFETPQPVVRTTSGSRRGASSRLGGGSRHHQCGDEEREGCKAHASLWNPELAHSDVADNSISSTRSRPRQSGSSRRQSSSARCASSARRKTSIASESPASTNAHKRMPNPNLQKSVEAGGRTLAPLCVLRYFRRRCYPSSLTATTHPEYGTAPASCGTRGRPPGGTCVAARSRPAFAPGRDRG